MPFQATNQIMSLCSEPASATHPPASLGRVEGSVACLLLSCPLVPTTPAIPHQTRSARGLRAYCSPSSASSLPPFLPVSVRVPPPQRSFLRQLIHSPPPLFSGSPVFSLLFLRWHTFIAGKLHEAKTTSGFVRGTEGAAVGSGQATASLLRCSRRRGHLAIPVCVHHDPRAS